MLCRSQNLQCLLQSRKRDESFLLLKATESGIQDFAFLLVFLSRLQIKNIEILVSEIILDKISIISGTKIK
jgi:hypothetical protein